MSSQVPNRDNYFDPTIAYTCTNPFTNKQEICFAEDWREGWRKEGELLGLPVIKLTNPKNPKDLALVRPHYLVGKEGALAETAEKAKIVFPNVFFIPESLVIEGKKYRLVSYYSEPIHDDRKKLERTAQPR